jgi:hypothetical protein
VSGSPGQPPRPDPDTGLPDPGSGGRPYLRIVRGEPTGAEVAALVTVLAGRAAAAARAAPPPRSAWADPARWLRGPVRPGPDAWRRSALP